MVELDTVLPCTAFLSEIGDDEAVWDGGKFISFRSFFVLVEFFMVVFVQNSDRVWPVLSLDPCSSSQSAAHSYPALIRGPVVAYGHQVFLVWMALSGIRRDFSAAVPTSCTLGSFFTTGGHMLWAMGIMDTTYSH